jgi:hypothetical protein
MRSQGLRALVNILPEENQILLKYLCAFLSRVAQLSGILFMDLFDFADVNKMTKNNLGVITYRHF